METIHRQTIEGETLEMDDKHFIDCNLINCVLRYSGGPLKLERTHVRGCNYIFFGPARSTVEFLQTMGLLSHAADKWGEFPQSTQ